jgi:large subunit ribosomal protein L15
MKLHDLRPAEGAHKAKTRVGRGIAAGKGKTAGRGTKGQKARAGGSIPPWFEGGQTPLHMRIPKLRGFKNRFKVEYEVVNVGAIGALAERGAFEAETPSGKAAKGSKGAGPITINADILRAVGLVRTPTKPLKILGAGDLSAALFVVADAFTASARAKIEAAGGVVNVLEIPSKPTPPLGVEAPASATRRARPDAEPAVVDDAPASDDAPTAMAVADAAPVADVEAAPAAEVEETPVVKAEETPVAEAEAAVEEAPAAAEVAAAPAKPARPKAAKAPKAKAKAKRADDDTPPAASAAPATDEAETPSGDDA